VRTVLLVEDDVAWLQILIELFQDLDFSIDSSNSLEMALPLLNKKHDLAVFDLSLSGEDHKNRDGLRLLERIQRIDPGCKSIMLTGFATVDIAVNAIVELGAVHFFRKESFNVAEFIANVNKLLPIANPNQTKEPSKFETVPNDPINTPHNSATALIIEDDENWRKVHREILEDIGVNAIECSSYGQAIGQINKGNFSLVLLDLNLRYQLPDESKVQNRSDLDGIQLLNRIKDKGIPIIIVSGLSSPALIDSIYSGQNIFAYFEKQHFSRPSLIQAIREAMLETEQKHKTNELTHRENEVLTLMVEGLTNKQIALRLFITPNTVKRHLKAIFEKFDVHTRSGVVAKAINR
jgi:DNA-binding NarL/FixJ family response regulator